MHPVSRGHEVKPLYEAALQVNAGSQVAYEAIDVAVHGAVYWAASGAVRMAVPSGGAVRDAVYVAVRDDVNK